MGDYLVQGCWDVIPTTVWNLNGLGKNRISSGVITPKKIGMPLGVSLAVKKLLVC